MTAPLTKTRTSIEAAWRSFVADGRLPDTVRPEIRRSWQRARAEWHVDPRLRTCPGAAGALARAEVDEAFRIASPLLKHFAARAAPDGHVVAYCDGDGRMLAVEGHRRTRSRLADVNFAPGACWAESSAGTNGIGTALVEDRPVEVFASEHFVEAWQPWTCASVPVRSGARIVGVVDITSPWTAYSPALLLTAEALARTIEAQLAASAIRRQNARLRELARDAVRARDEFLAVASHELKTPLTPLQLKIQKLQRLLARAGPPVGPEEIVEALRGAEGHVLRVVEFVDDLLDTSRVVLRPLRLAPRRTDLAATVHRVLDRHRQELAQQRCDVEVDAAPEVIGHWDPERLGQAFKQLLSNAIKYAPGRIEVVIAGDEVTARLVVRDHGPGIAPENHDRVFRPFQRAVSYRHTPGFGLGLLVVRQIAEAHGGTVHVESTLGKGSTFVVELPLQAQC
jgi:sigma-54 dependent transcriptional regulator, acetoin dehydrogenase operon transcriptional activator AcoR